MTACECCGSAGKMRLHKKRKSQLELTEKWKIAVVDYSQRHLTYMTDRLQALSGYARRYQAHLNSEYLAGLWASGLPSCLTWYRIDHCDFKSGPGPEIDPSFDKSAPSWSWASLQSQVCWSSKDNSCLGFAVGITSGVIIANINCQPSTGNKFGGVRKGSYIELVGNVVDAEMESNIHGCGSVTRKGFKPRIFRPDCPIILKTEGSLDASNSEHVSLVAKAVPETISKEYHEPWLRRATSTDQPLLETPQYRVSRTKGTVACLLLYTTTTETNSTEKDGTHPRILILGKDLIRITKITKISFMKDWASQENRSIDPGNIGKNTRDGRT